jgi:hypothetical protein
MTKTEARNFPDKPRSQLPRGDADVLRKADHRANHEKKASHVAESSIIADLAQMQVCTCRSNRNVSFV